VTFKHNILFFIIIFGIFACNPDPVKTDGVSIHMTQRRLPGESFDDAEARYRKGLDQLSLDDYSSSLSVKSGAAATDSLNSLDLGEFGNLELLQTAFAKLRDYQFMDSSSHPEIRRRSTWLYPDDGCFARADLAVQNLSGWKYTPVKKIFVFGELTVATANAVGGEVSWWFHVAPITKVNGQLYVMDPAVNPAGPLALSEWLGFLSSDPDKLLVNLCNSTAYVPHSRCASADVADLSRSLVDQQEFLDPEWDRLLELNRKPAEELGDHPPWLDE
jgi:hypothetical protein